MTDETKQEPASKRICLNVELCSFPDILQHFVYWVQNGLTPYDTDDLILFENGTIVRYLNNKQLSNEELQTKAIDYLKAKTLPTDSSSDDDDSDFEEDEDHSMTLATPLSTEKEGVTFIRIAKEDFQDNELRCFTMVRVLGPVSDTPMGTMILMTYRLEQTKAEMQNLGCVLAKKSFQKDINTLDIKGIIRNKKLFEYKNKTFVEESTVLVRKSEWSINSSN